MRSARQVDAIVVGAGFAGLYALYRLRELGLSVQAFEAGSGVGGTWFWNRYPGARCDVESLAYSYSFSAELEQEWVWSERYPAQREILAYLNHVADRFDLRRAIELETRVVSATYDDASASWTVRTDREQQVTTRFVVLATGCLSAWQVPRLSGLESFAGPTYHTGNWPHEDVDCSGLRIGVVGTGSSGIQVIPALAETAEHVVVFQRTPNFSVPARNAPLDPEHQRRLKANYDEFRNRARESASGIPVEPPTKSALDVPADERRRVYEQRWAKGGAAPLLSAFTDLMTDADANETAAAFVRSKIAEIVTDPNVAELLSPTDHPLGTKRICVDTDYYATFNRDNVTLVDIKRTPIESVTPGGIRTSERDYELDAIVFATGYDAITGSFLRIDIRGRDGATLREEWAEGPRTFLGIQAAGFPNLFFITGPGSPSVLSNMVVSIEQHVEWMADLVAHTRAEGLATVEPLAEAVSDWVEYVNEVADQTLYPTASSWYVGANIPGKPRVFMPYIGGVGTYRGICDEIAGAGYVGLAFGAAGSRETILPAEAWSRDVLPPPRSRSEVFG